MVENVGRKITFVAIVLAVALAFLIVPDKPFQMGLDLRGGTRLVYSFPFEDAARQGQITREEAQNPAQLLDQTVNIIRSRIDPQGLLDASIRVEGTNRIVIELPGRPDVAGNQAFSTLHEGLAQGYSLSLVLDPDDEGVGAFPDSGTVLIGDEKIRYDRRDGNVLYELERGKYGTAEVVHAKGAPVELSSDDAIRDIIENLGELAFLIEAKESDFFDKDTDFAREEQKLQDWTSANPGVPIVNFAKVAPEDGGPDPSIKWIPRKSLGETDTRTEFERRMMLLRPASADEEFAGGDVAKVFGTQDRAGFPAVGFEMQSARKGDFGRFTGDNKGRNLVITLNDQVESVATINSRLPGSGIIEGRFKQAEVDALVTVIRSGSLRIKPTLEHEDVVGPTLGQDYVERGAYSALAGLLAVLAFMLFYYRRLGVFAAVSLAASMLMLMGGLAFLHATLTLPGIAGIILTLGMAVDANILIFDRIREEADKGQNARQAAKIGFDRAFSAIFDANLTTLLTALILYGIGTGPVKGFAVTLSIGIIGSMISALIITRLLVHFSLERGVKGFPIGTWLVKANYDFLSKARIAMPISALAILAGVTFFVVTPNQEKLGIDFLGGAEIQINTEEAQAIDALRARVAAIPGDVGESATVKPVIATGVGDDRYTSFRIAFKVDEETRGEGSEKELQSRIRDELGEILQRGPIELSEPREDGANRSWDVTLYFVDDHPVADLQAGIAAESEIRFPFFTKDPERPVYSGTLQTPAVTSPEQLKVAIQRAFNQTQDSGGVTFNLSEPIPSSSLVGPQVVGELRNKAIIALVVSLFAIVLYIRVRFAEYSYGFAAVAALIHDVLITLGLLTLANHLGLISGEINLPMIAAFLTIIGYSLNDTIVIFDRVRENLPRMKKPLVEVLNLSINQTLSRTLLTSLTTLMAVLFLFAFNVGTGNVLEGFAFAMTVGVVTGTYSTIFIANPVLLWLENRAAAKDHARAGGGERKKGGSDAKLATKSTS